MLTHQLIEYQKQLYHPHSLCGLNILSSCILNKLYMKHRMWFTYLVSLYSQQTLHETANEIFTNVPRLNMEITRDYQIFITTHHKIHNLSITKFNKYEILVNFKSYFVKKLPERLLYVGALDKDNATLDAT